MLRMFVFAAGFIMIAFAIRFFKDEIMLYKNGVKNEATLILMKPYNHVDINEVRNKVYNTLEEGLRAYRNISYEKYADEFAIDFINKFGAELTHIVDSRQSVESVKEFLEME